MLNGCVLCASMICSQANFFVATLFWKNKSVLYTNIHNTGNDAISCVRIWTTIVPKLQYECGWILDIVHQYSQ